MAGDPRDSADHPALSFLCPVPGEFPRSYSEILHGAYCTLSQVNCALFKGK